jgi:exopolysaccharide biosynthesis polyprenyl glycosylphosphotransferase
MKRSELFFDAVLLPIDFISLLLAGMLAYYLRLSPYVQRVRPALFVVDLPFREYMGLVTIVSTLIVAIFALQGLYAMRIRRRLFDELTRMFAGISMGVMAVIIYTFLSAEIFQSRFILLAAYLFALVLVALGRFLIRRAQLYALRQGYGVYRVVLVGNGRYGVELAQLIRRRPGLGLRVVGDIPQVQPEALEKVYQQFGIDEVIQTEPTMSDEDNLALLDFCDQYKIDYSYVPNLFEAQATNVRFRQIQGVPLVELLRTPLDGWGRITKRGMDMVLSLVGLAILSPLLIAVALLIRLDSPGSIFYRQVRIGRNKKSFEIIKFRTMRMKYCTGERYGGPEAEAMEQKLRIQTNERNDGPLFKMKTDPRCTRVGAYLRRWRIDELPQLFNVLGGEMSLLGPRPHLPKEVELYSKHHRKLFTIKPGMSGMAQVQGSSGLPFEEEAKLDIGYIENWSLKLDIILLIRTLRLIFTDKNAV